MLKRLTRSLTVLFVLLAALGAYRLLAVPLIEPSAERQVASDRPANVNWAAEIHERQRIEMAHWFPPGSWQLDEPKVLETDRAKLLFQDYKNRADGRVHISPCTMIFLPSNPELTLDERRGRAIILEAPEGAILEFDEPLDLRRAKIGRLIGAEIHGAVTMRSDYRAPGPDDDLYVETHELKMSDAQVNSEAPVVFRLGENRGSGRGLQIDLLSSAKPNGAHDPGVGGIKAFRLLSEVQLELQVPAGGMGPGQRQSAQDGATTPMQITCTGPLDFDAVKHVLTFNQQVRVLRLHADAQPDELLCEVLALEMMPAPGPDGGPAPPSSGFKTPKLVARRIEARGEQVTLRAPASDAEAFGQRLEYDFVSGQVGLRSLQTAMIRYQNNEIHAPEIYYRPEPGRKIGHFMARGAGWLRGFMPGEGAQQVEAHWVHELRLYPDLDQAAPAYVLSARGEAHLAAVGLGSLDGGEIHAWLLEAPPQFSPLAPVHAAADLAAAAGAPVAPPDTSAADAAFRLVPDKLLATTDVHIDTSQLLCDVDRLELWFENVPLSAQPLPGVIAPADLTGPPAPITATVAPPVADPLAAPPADAAPPAPSSRLQVAGGQLRAKALVRGTQTQLSQLVLESDVSIREVGLVAAGTLPIVIEGDHVHVDQADPMQSEVIITGSPAHIEARGLVLDGAQIHLQQAANRLWVDGAGHMILPVDRDLEGQQTATPQQLDLTWTGRMDFDGARAVFERDVVARLSTQTLRTATMTVELDGRVEFKQANASRPELARLICAGGVTIESREFAANQPTSIALMALGDLRLEQRTGEITGQGPGRLRLWRRGGDPLGGGPGGAGLPVLGRPREPAAPSAPGSSDDQLTYLGVDFQGNLTGNMQQRTTTFHDQVRVVYAPATGWNQEVDADDPQQMGERGIVMTCNQLTAAQVASPRGDRRTAELVAAGNPVVEGQQFTARAQRITYAELKDVLTLEGTGRQLAELHQQQRPGSPPQRLTAATIRYRPSTREVEIDGATFLDLNQPPGQR